MQTHTQVEYPIQGGAARTKKNPKKKIRTNAGTSANHVEHEQLSQTSTVTLQGSQGSTQPQGPSQAPQGLSQV